MNRVSVDEAAARSGISRPTIFIYLRRGYLRRYRLPNLDRRTFVDLDELLALKRVKAGLDQQKDLEQDGCTVGPGCALHGNGSAGRSCQDA